MEFLNKLYNKVVFSDAPELNIGAMDMGEEQTAIRLTKDAVARLATATGTVGSMEIFIPVEMDVSIDKTSPMYSQWVSRLLKNAYIGGSVTVYDDVNISYTGTKPSVSCSDFGKLNGTDPQVTFTVHANLRVNTEALAGFNI